MSCQNFCFPTTSDGKPEDSCKYVGCPDLKLKEAENTIANKDVIIDMLKTQVKKLESSYMNNMNETENFRFKYCLASEQMKRMRCCSEACYEKVQKLQIPCKCVTALPSSVNMQEILNSEKILTSNYELMKLLLSKFLAQKDSDAEAMLLQREITRLQEENTKLLDLLEKANKNKEILIKRDSIVQTYKRTNEMLRDKISRMDMSELGALEEEDFKETVSASIPSTDNLGRVSFLVQRPSVEVENKEVKEEPVETLQEILDAAIAQEEETEHNNKKYEEEPLNESNLLEEVIENETVLTQEEHAKEEENFPEKSAVEEKQKSISSSCPCSSTSDIVENNTMKDQKESSVEDGSANKQGNRIITASNTPNVIVNNAMPVQEDCSVEEGTCPRLSDIKQNQGKRISVSSACPCSVGISNLVENNTMPVQEECNVEEGTCPRLGDIKQNQGKRISVSSACPCSNPSNIVENNTMPVQKECNVEEGTCPRKGAIKQDQGNQISASSAHAASNTPNIIENKAMPVQKGCNVEQGTCPRKGAVKQNQGNQISASSAHAASNTPNVIENKAMPVQKECDVEEGTCPKKGAIKQNQGNQISASSAHTASNTPNIIENNTMTVQGECSVEDGTCPRLSDINQNEGKRISVSSACPCPSPTNIIENNTMPVQGECSVEEGTCPRLSDIKQNQGKRISVSSACPCPSPTNILVENNTMPVQKESNVEEGTGPRIQSQEGKRISVSSTCSCSVGTSNIIENDTMPVQKESNVEEGTGPRIQNQGKRISVSSTCSCSVGTSDIILDDNPPIATKNSGEVSSATKELKSISQGSDSVIENADKISHSSSEKIIDSKEYQKDEENQEITIQKSNDSGRENLEEERRDSKEFQKMNFRAEASSSTGDIKKCQCPKSTSTVEDVFFITESEEILWQEPIVQDIEYHIITLETPQIIEEIKPILKKDNSSQAISGCTASVFCSLANIRAKIVEMAEKQEAVYKELESIKNKMAVTQETTEDCKAEIAKLKEAVEGQEVTFLEKFEENKIITDDLKDANQLIRDELEGIKDKIALLSDLIDEVKNRQHDFPITKFPQTRSTSDDLITIEECRIENTKTSGDVKKTSSVKSANSRLQNDFRCTECVNNLLNQYNKVNKEMASLAPCLPIDLETGGGPDITESYIEKIKDENNKLKTTISSTIDHINEKLKEMNLVISGLDVECQCIKNQESSTNTAKSDTEIEYTKREGDNTQIEEIYPVSRNCFPLSGSSSAKSPCCDCDDQKLSIEDIYKAVRCSCRKKQKTIKKPCTKLIPSSKGSIKNREICNTPKSSCKCVLGSELPEQNCIVQNLENYVVYLHKQLETISSIERQIEDMRIDIKDSKL